MLMNPIQTMYKDVLFRSRLEARHALLFDILGIKWEYELEGYTLSDGSRYLPDFFLPDVYIRDQQKPGVFFEVKPTFADAQKNEGKFCKFERPLVVSCGTPNTYAWRDEWLFEWWKERWDNFMFLKYCEICKIYEIEYSESSYCKCRLCGGDAEEIKDWAYAISNMKSYRF